MNWYIQVASLVAEQLKTLDLTKLEKIKKSAKLHRIITKWSSFSRKENFVSTSKRRLCRPVWVTLMVEQMSVLQEVKRTVIIIKNCYIQVPSELLNDLWLSIIGNYVIPEKFPNFIELLPCAYFSLPQKKFCQYYQKSHEKLKSFPHKN